MDDVASLGTILGVWAHPDDDIFLSAGLMATAVRAAQRVVDVTATRGEGGSMDEERWPPDSMGEVRTKELLRSLEILGVQEHRFLEGPIDVDMESHLDEAGAAQVRQGVRVFRNPRLGLAATVLQLGAWGIQWLSCYALLAALGLDDLAGMGAAAAVLFAVNVTAVLPATPSNLGVFQAACVAVLSSYHVGYADALAYGIILQAVEIATAVVMGAPALVREGVSWRDVRLRAMNYAPVELEPLPAGSGRGEARAEA